MAACPDFREYVHRLAAAGSKTLEALFLFEPGAGRPVRVLVYDPHLPWAGRVVRAAGVPTAALLSQPCSVDVVYGEVYTGRVGLSVVDRAPGPAERRPGTGGRAVVRGGAGVVPCVTGRGGRSVRWVGGRRRRVRQLKFHELETKEADYLASTWRVKTIGPTLPSFYLDDDRPIHS
ncbi:hypothetical protein ZWY2020_040643 [Hordeum vulgare]|nr:hypothetical protein ZWY2020_040643 [Hordeum vulgare]